MITCAITTSVLGCIVTSFLFFRYTWCLDLSFLQKYALFALFILMGCIPLLVSANFENILGKFYIYYRYCLYFIFIGCIILFATTLIVDAVIWLLSYTPALNLLKYGCKYLNYFNLILALIFTTYALYAGTKVPAVKSLDLFSPKITNSRKIVVLSDLHIERGVSPQKITKIVAQTNELNPDVIILAGDILDDDVAKIAETAALLKGLKAKQGIFFVTGNHEFYTGYHETVSELQKLGFTFLENGGVSLDEIYLAGIPDLFSGQSFGKTADLAQAFANSDDKQYRVLVSHTPADFGAENSFELEVSGHTHGGQIFPFHLFAKLHNRYLAGLYEMAGGSQIYVSRGAGQWGPQMRFLAPSEITVINLKPQN